MMSSSTPSPVEGGVLTALAVAAIRAKLLNEALPAMVPESEILRAPGASFVTLERRGQLRGCIGTVEPVRPLYLDVVRNARYAMVDPRLPPVTREDWPELDVKVSVLTPLEPLSVTGRDELIAALRPGVDGLLLTDGFRRATFLPAVWSRLPDPARFVSALLAKGGWPPNGFPENLQVRRYTAVEFHDPAPRAGLAYTLDGALSQSALPSRGALPSRAAEPAPSSDSASPGTEEAQREALRDDA